MPAHVRQLVVLIMHHPIQPGVPVLGMAPCEYNSCIMLT